jgi:2,3-bisphosphoglycerate-independent phosphoglycerate mutase
MAALDEYDLVFVHVEAPDEAGHLGNAAEKVKAIEQVDRHVVGPVLEKLHTFSQWRILIAPDHPTPVEKRVHTSAPPPFCMAGTGIRSEPRARARGPASTTPLTRFTEANSLSSGVRVEAGHELIRRFLSSSTTGTASPPSPG